MDNSPSTNETAVIDFDEFITIYLLDSNGVYLYEYNILKHKYKDANWHTMVKPPITGDMQCAVFNRQNYSWDIIEDYRGYPVLNTKTGQQDFVDYIGPLKEPHVLVDSNGIDYMVLNK